MKTVWLYCILLLCTLPCKAQNLEFEAINDIPGAYITSIQELSTGDIIVTTPQGVWSGNSALSEWKKISSGIADSTILCSAIGINNTIFVGTPTGVYKSSNQGLQWIKTGNNFSSKEVRHLSVHPNGTVYAGVNKRLYRSKDNGSTWQIFADSVMKLVGGDAQIGIVHLGENNRIIVLNYYSDDDGKKWRRSIFPAGYFAPESQEVILNYFSSKKGYVFLCYTDSSNLGGSLHGRFMVSTDNGNEWGISSYMDGSDEGKPKVLTKEQYHNFHYLNNKQASIEIIPLTGDTVLLCSYHSLPMRVKVSVAKQNSFLLVTLKYLKKAFNGLTSTQITSSLMLSDGNIIVGTYGAGLFLSKDKGTTWSNIRLPLNAPILTCFTRSVKNQQTLLGTTNGLFYVDSIKNTFKEIPLPSEFDKSIIDVAIHPKTGELFIVDNKGIFRLKANQWEQVYQNYINYPCNDIYFYGDTLIMATSVGVTFTTDFTKWQIYTTHDQESLYGYFTYYNTKKSYPFSVSDINVLYYSKLYGSIFLNSGLPTFRISPHTEKKFPPYNFAATEGNTNDDFYIGNEAGVFKLDLLSNAWLQDKKTGLTKDRVLALASNQTGEVFAGALTGAFRSTDKALTWIGLPQFPTKAVRSLAIDHEGYIYAGLAWGGIYKSKQSSVQLSAPELTNPAHKSTEIKLKSDANWKTVKYATGYHIQIAEDSLFVTPIVNDSTLGVNVKPLNGLLSANTLYYWRARATFGNFRGEWSTTNSFITETILPEKLQLQKPTDKSPNISVTPLLQWSKSIQSQAYHVQVSRKQDFFQQETEDSTLTTAEKNITNLEEGTNYYWRVRGKNKAGYGLWSDIWSFTTKQGTNSVYENREDTGLSLSVEGEELTIRNNPYNHTQSVLIITDLIGQKVVSIPLERGTKTQTLTIGKLQKGFYNVSLLSDSGTISKSIIVPW